MTDLHELLNFILQSLISFVGIPSSAIYAISYWAIERWLEVNKKVMCFVVIFMSLFLDLA